MAQSWTDQFKGWAESARKTSVWLLCMILTVLAGFGLWFMYADVYTSYQGWGRFAETAVRAGAIASGLAWGASIVVTLLQTAWFTASTSGAKFVSEHRLLKYLAFGLFGLDTFMDFYQLFDPASEAGLAKWIAPILIPFVLYGLLSEFLVSFCVPVAFTLWKELLKDVDLSIAADEFGPAPKRSQGRQQRGQQPGQQRGRQSRQGQQPSGRQQSGRQPTR
jgi:hypothetical protein